MHSAVFLFFIHAFEVCWWPYIRVIAMCRSTDMPWVFEFTPHMQLCRLQALAGLGVDGTSALGMGKAHVLVELEQGQSTKRGPRLLRWIGKGFAIPADNPLTTPSAAAEEGSQVEPPKLGESAAGDKRPPPTLSQPPVPPPIRQPGESTVAITPVVAQ